ncbi:hypothetical protein ACVGVM_20855 [Pseudonocardia bannensis]|uniref:Uncharacterized protein n=1 Tax=Pseudonocardia bannensis TaxID=630973 RepID=A0A848DSS3_9PSEU|nr:hypothetical protein [Pseudonocardia bannensis]NMH95456.1 hypothetical protein [Pseudonocardia bannensis]
MDASAIGWWTCPECGSVAELPGADTAGYEVSCPDCSGPMIEQWQWEYAAA